MQTTLAVTALLMGLVGGPHCLAMCGAACAGIGRSASAGQGTRALWIFQFGRLAGYSALGGLAAASMQGLGWLSIQSAALRPVWTLFHVAAALMGLMLLWQARQPAWLETTGQQVWRKVRSVTRGSSSGAPLLLGFLWALLPCGLLYSALLVAALTSHAAEGAAVMALFAAGSSVSLMAGPWLWLRLRKPGSGQWAIRLAGLALFLVSVAGLRMGLVHNTAPWCLPD
ncbi:MAG TPA: sulfite exporter TauE/SafE family protein [Polaromonas sp.]|uniref:sulfite exporter TauE/SafE family protein n=1 Tax=Polaromonas sp. TaxID=1869339 RepID=UPI002D54AE59|nr:sulfite exporter TauE/SafE family protein [Polaromonas sp.]HYW58041.1 sulfite exporter TauE/SafE family protein [Polaromonas sp.]